MTAFYLKILLIISKLAKLQTFIIITVIILITICLCNKKMRKVIVSLYVLYFLGIFLFFFPINKYGTDIITLYFIKRKLTPKSFNQFKIDMISKKKLGEKILSSYFLSKDIKYQIKKLDKEISSVEKEFKKTKGVEKKFIPWVDTTNII